MTRLAAKATLKSRLIKAEYVAVVTIIILTLLATFFSVRRSNLSPSLSINTGNEILGLKISDHNNLGEPLNNDLISSDEPMYSDAVTVALKREDDGGLIKRSRLQGELEYRDNRSNYFSWEGIRTLWGGIGPNELLSWKNSGSGLLGGYGPSGGFQTQAMTVADDKLYIASATSVRPNGYDGDCRYDTKYGTTIANYSSDNFIEYGWTLDKRDGLFSDTEQRCERNDQGRDGPQESKTSGVSNLVLYKGKLIALTHQTKNVKESDGIKSKYVYVNDAPDNFNKRSNWRLAQPANFGGDYLNAGPINKGSLIIFNYLLYLLGEKYLYRANENLNWEQVSVIDPTDFNELNYRFTDTMTSFNNELYVAHFRHPSAPSGKKDSKTEIKILKNNLLESVYHTEANYQPVHFFIHESKIFLILRGLPLNSGRDKIIYSRDGRSWSELSSLPFGTNEARISTAISFSDTITNQSAIYLATSGENQKTGEIKAPSQIWRSIDGSSWIKTGPRDICTGDRFCDNFDISGFQIYRGELYALTRNQTDENGGFSNEYYQWRGSELYKLKISRPDDTSNKAQLQLNLPTKTIYRPKAIRIGEVEYGIQYDTNDEAIITGGSGSVYNLEITKNIGSDLQSDFDDWYRILLSNISKGDLIHNFKVIFDNERVSKDKLLNLEQYLVNNQVNNTYLGGIGCESGANIAKVKVCLTFEAIISAGNYRSSLQMRQSINRLGEIIVEGNVAGGLKIEGLTLFNEAIFVGGKIENVSGGSAKLPDYIKNATLDWSKVSVKLDKLFERRRVTKETVVNFPYSGNWYLNSRSNNPKDYSQDSFSNQPEGKLWRISTNDNAIFDGANFRGKGTLFLENNKSITIKNRLGCQDKTSLALITKGDIIFEGNVSAIECGAFITTGGNIIFRKPNSSVSHKGIFVSANNIIFPQPNSLNGPMIIYYDSYLADNPPIFLQELLKIINLAGR